MGNKIALNIANYSHGVCTVLSLFKNLVLYFTSFLELSFKLSDLVKTFCTKSRTKPTPNSTADKTKKKKVKDKKLALSYTIPRDNTSTYKVIHKISAVSSRCNAELTLIVILTIISIKKII